MSRRGKMSMEQVRACPKAEIKFIKEVVHGSKAATNECFDLGISSECYIVIKSEESKNEAAEHVCRRIDSNLFEEDSFLTKRRINTTVQNIQLKGVNSTKGHFK